MNYLKQATRNFKNAKEQFAVALDNGDIKDIRDKLYTLEDRAEELINQGGINFTAIQIQLHQCRDLMRVKFKQLV